MTSIAILQDKAQLIIGTQAHHYIQTHILSRKIVIGIRKLFRTKIGDLSEEIRAYLKLVSLCEPKQYSITYSGDTDEIEHLDTILETIVDAASRQYVTINVSGGTKKDACDNISTILMRMTDYNPNLFLHTIRL